MKKLTLTLAVVFILMGIAAANAAAQGTVSIDEWFAENTLDVDLWKGLTLSPKTSVNLTRISGEFDITDEIDVNASYTFGTTDSDADVTMLQVAGNYEIRDGVKLGIGYLSNNFDSTDVHGIYAQAAGTLPIADNLALTGKVGFSPMLEAEQGNFREEATMTSVDLGLSYNWKDFEISGGYRYQNYALDINHISGSYDFSGLYVGAAYNF